MNMEENNEVEQLRMQVERLEEEVERLTKINVSLAAGSESLIKRNMDLYKRLDSYYNVRMRVNWLKELMRHHREVMANADLRDDDELLALIEARIEGDEIPLPPGFGVKDVAKLKSWLPYETDETLLAALDRLSEMDAKAKNYR